MSSAPILIIIDDDPVRCAVYQCNFTGSAAGGLQLAFPRTVDAGQRLAQSGLVQAVVCAQPLLTAEFRTLAEQLRAGALAQMLWLTVEEGEGEGGEDTARNEAAQLGINGEVDLDFRPEPETSLGPPADLPFPFEEKDLLSVIARRQPRTPSPTSIKAQAPAAADPWARFAERIEALHHGLDQVSYYQLLGVEDTCDAGKIQLAYEQRSLELHPDRFLQLEDAVLREKLYTIYKRMVEAFRVLDNPQHRAMYDKHLSSRSGVLRLVSTERPKKQDLAKNPWDVARTSSGKTLLRSAIESVQTGQHRKALQLFRAALQVEPDNAAIRERYEAAQKILESQPQEK